MEDEKTIEKARTDHSSSLIFIVDRHGRSLRSHLVGWIVAIEFRADDFPTEVES